MVCVRAGLYALHAIAEAAGCDIVDSPVILQSHRQLSDTADRPWSARSPLAVLLQYLDSYSARREAHFCSFNSSDLFSASVFLPLPHL